jgi:hypothetical protein
MKSRSVGRSQLVHITKIISLINSIERGTGTKRNILTSKTKEKLITVDFWLTLKPRLIWWMTYSIPIVVILVNSLRFHLSQLQWSLASLTSYLIFKANISMIALTLYLNSLQRKTLLKIPILVLETNKTIDSMMISTLKLKTYRLWLIMHVIAQMIKISQTLKTYWKLTNNMLR